MAGAGTVVSVEDNLAALHRQPDLEHKLEYLHAQLQARFSALGRVAVATYDAETDRLKTFIASDRSSDPLRRYEASLKRSPSLRRILEEGIPRVVNDLEEFDQADRPHTKRILQEGYRSSYTMPIFNGRALVGLIFFDATRRSYFTPEVRAHLNLFGHLISLVVTQELTAIHTLHAAVNAARRLARERDVETGAHLDRMSRYARLIAMEVAPSFGLSDEIVEYIFLFAPLHDIGKIAVPDQILRKPGRLTPDERMQMRKHVPRGVEIVNGMMDDFRLHRFQHAQMLRNIVRYHHESLDGTGYPDGVRGDDIPVEARIVSVADVFDAMTSWRPYKEAWQKQAVLDELGALAGVRLDRSCVEALLDNSDKVLEIQARFHEDPYG